MTTKTDNMVDVSTHCESFALVEDAITRTQALHELISDAGRIAVLPPARYLVGNLENAGSKE
jgi:hypothetical protein